MRSQDVIWTALPNGRQADVYRVSVHVSPRLLTDEGLPIPRLIQFKDFLNWPATAIKFKVKLGAGPPVDAAIVTKPPAANDLWTAVFKLDTYVRPHKFDALLGRKVRSYPVRHVRGFIKDLYTRLVSESPSDRPDFERLMAGPDGQRRRGLGELNFVDEASLKEDRKRRLIEQLEQEFPFIDRERQQRWGAIPFNPDDPPVKSFLQLERFHAAPPAVFRLGSLGEGVREGRLNKWLVAVDEAVSVDQPLCELQTVKGPLRVLSPWAGTVLALNTPVGGTVRVGDTLCAEPGARGGSMALLRKDFVKKLEPFNKKPTLKDSGPEGAVDFHQVLSFAADHPSLMRLFGLVVDLEFKPGAVRPGANTVQVLAEWQPQLSTTQNYSPITRCLVGPTDFMAAPRAADPDLVDGALPFDSRDRYEIVEIDHDGVGLKAMNFADNLGRSRLTQHRTDDTPQSYAPPSIRSGGLSLARVGHATRLVASLMNSKNLNDNFRGSVTLDAEDVTRGFVVHVWDSKTAKWHSLTRRKGAYEFLSKPETVAIEDEAAITIGPTSSFDGSTSDLYQPETLFRWTGWSLAAARPGKAMVLDPAHDPGGHSQRIESAAAEDFKLQIRFKAKPGSLPRLRYGLQYRLRARGVDLAGNRPDFGKETDPDPHATTPITYARFEPVDPPLLLLRRPRTMGESVERMVIRRKFNAPPQPDRNERHLSPPKSSQLLAEEHGLFDTPGGLDKSAFNLIAARENASYQTSLQGKSDPDDFEHSRYFDVDDLTMPFLPDPFARGAAFKGLPGRPPDEVLAMRFTPTGKPWPEYSTIRIVLEEGKAPSSQPSPDGRVLKIVLPEAEVVTVRYSCFLNAADLDKMGIWLWLDEKTRTRLQPDAIRGQLWALTPYRQLVLVHAVQQPLMTPEFPRLVAVKGSPGTVDQAGSRGQTFASLTGLATFSRKSTAAIKVFASWPEAIDEGPGTRNPTLAPHPQQRGFSFDLPLGTFMEDQVAFGALKHEFHDTKYRRVTYTAVASTKFGEYFAKRKQITLTGTAAVVVDAIGLVPGTVHVTSADGQTAFNLTNDYALDYAQGTIARVTGSRIADGAKIWIGYQAPPTTRETEKPVTLDIPNSARPDAPKVLYVIPTWTFDEKKGALGTIRSTRRGGGLRVYLDRPWWSSGEGELLGVLLWRPTGPFQFEPPQQLQPYVTRWGVDPIHATGRTNFNPTLDRFPRRVVEAGSPRPVTLDERPGTEVLVAGHPVDFDPVRKLWYCEIDVITDQSYMPFIRLALARYQPRSLRDAHISRVVLADFAQVAPDRTVLITFNAQDPALFRVTVMGLSYDGTRGPGRAFTRGPAQMHAHIEQRSERFAGELAWETVAGTDVTLRSSPVRGGGTIWEQEMRRPNRKWPFRLVLEETEPLAADVRPDDRDRDKPVKRIVFTEVLPLTPDEVGVISASPGSLDFGSQRVGIPGAEQTITVRNAGNAELRVGAVRIVGADAGDFQRVSDLASGKRLKPGDTRTVNVRFNPTRWGPRSARVEVPGDGVGTAVVKLKGLGLGPELEMVPAALDFGPRALGTTTDPMPVQLRNRGNADLQLGVIEITGPNMSDFDITDDPSDLLVPPGGVVLLSVSFTPGALGQRSAAASIASDAPGSPHQVPLKGVGGVAKAGVAPTVIDFGDQPAGSVSRGQTAIVSNTGTAPMHVLDVSISSGNLGEFQIVDDTASGEIPPGGSGRVVVVFAPTAPGTKAATLRISHDAPEPDLTVTLKGRAT